MGKCFRSWSVRITSILMALTLAIWFVGAVTLYATQDQHVIDPDIDDQPLPPDDSCGFVLDTAAYLAEIQQIEAGGYPVSAAPETFYRTYYVPMTIHVVRTSAGTGGLTTTQVAAAINNLNANFAQVQIQLFQQGNIHLSTTTTTTPLTTITPMSHQLAGWRIRSTSTSCPPSNPASRDLAVSSSPWSRICTPSIRRSPTRSDTP